MARPLLSVVVPTRNEADNVGPLTERLLAALDGTAAEICFVDDSDDATRDALERLQREHPDTVRCLFRQGRERIGGLSTAVVGGLRMARGTYVCVMDADLQHPPETIPAMLAAAREGADLVVASRYTRGGSHGGLDGLGRRVVSRGAGAAARLLFEEARRSTDPLSGFFLCRRDVLDGIEFRPVGFKILLELLVCIPRLQVRDVPLAFQPREHGASKASARQGLLYLRHLRSLVLQVEGSARLWKFALVGATGLAVFLPVLALLAGAAHLPDLVAFIPAWALSLAWNTTLNRVWTFADMRRRAGGEGPGRYLRYALLSGALMFAVYALLAVTAGWPAVAAGAVAAGAGMVANGLVNRAQTRRPPEAWAGVATDRGVQAALARLAEQVGADRAFVLPPRPAAPPATVPVELLERTVRLCRPAVWTEAPSHRPQRRTNIEARSTMLVPVVRDGRVLAVLVCQRQARDGFDRIALEASTHAVEGLATLLVGIATTRVPAAAPSTSAPAAG